MLPIVDDLNNWVDVHLAVSQHFTQDGNDSNKYQRTLSVYLRK
jgi:hypothetical protein